MTVWDVLTGGDTATSTGTVIADDILASEGGVIVKRGPVAVHQTAQNGFDLFRQHHDGSNPRPPLSVGGYPHGLWVQAVGAESDGYGSSDAGGGTYANLGRDREGVYVTDSYWLAVKATNAGAMPELRLYRDTEGWGSLRRSYFMVRIDFVTGEVQIRPDAGGWVTVATLGPSYFGAWNDNKYDRHYVALTTWRGHSTSTGTDFGHYVALQIGGRVFDLRGIGGSAAYDPSPIAQPGSVFSGGDNPGLSIVTPTAGVAGGVVLFEFVRTIGDSIAA